MGHRAWAEDNKRRMSAVAELQGRRDEEAGDTPGEGGTDDEEEEEEEDDDDDDDERGGSGGSGG